MKKDTTILILGAGVSGLSTAILLLKKGYHVIIWAKDLPPHTTSNKAAAIWYPYLCNPKDKATQWAKTTLDYLYKEILHDPNSGCTTRIVTEIFDKKIGEPWWKDAITRYIRPTEKELPSKYVDGYQIEGILMDTSIYMDYLVNMLKKLGGNIIQKEVTDIQEPFQRYDVIINCTGLGSHILFNDSDMYPVRGQVIRIKPNGFDQVIADDEGHNNLTVIIPRLHDIILGGTAQKNNWNLEIDPKDTEDIIRKCREINPIFEEIEIIEEYVGLRPGRTEVRLELEKKGTRYIIHNYGHGGAGFTLSWGCAKNVVDILEEIKLKD